MIILQIIIFLFAVGLGANNIWSPVIPLVQFSSGSILRQTISMGVHTTLSQTAVLGDTDEQKIADHLSQSVSLENLELAKHDYQSDEDVVVTVQNPDAINFQVKIMDMSGREIPVIIEKNTYANISKIVINASNNRKPGKYLFTILDSTGKTLQQDFTWGMLVVDSDKAVYRPKESGQVLLEVRDAQGNNNCDASINMEIIKPDSQKDLLSTENKKIVVNKECYAKESNIAADFSARYDFTQAGEYKAKISAVTDNTTVTINKTFQVKDDALFAIKRESKMRIYGKNVYSNSITITAMDDFDDIVTESVPDGFTILSAKDSEPTYSVSQIAIDDKPTSELSSGQTKLDPKTTHLRMPYDGTFAISQGFGALLTEDSLKDFYTHLGLTGHDGLDFALPTGTPLHAVDEGDVIFSGPGYYGNGIIIQHSWGKSIYGHLSTTEIAVGSHVLKGAEIGLSGDSGESTGPHLHFGIKPNNPDLHNGYDGMIDPLPYLPLEQRNQNLHALTMANPSVVLGISTVSETSPNTPEATQSANAESLLKDQNNSALMASDSGTLPLETPISSIATQASQESFGSIEDQIRTRMVTHHETTDTNIQVVTWKLSLKKGESKVLTYAFKKNTPEPNTYTFGPITLYDKVTLQPIYSEQNPWYVTTIEKADNWLSDSWQYRKKIIIDHTKVGLPGFDQASSAIHAENVPSVSWKHTTTEQDNRLLLVAIATQKQRVSSVTYDGQVLQKRLVQSCEKENCNQELWYLKNPPSGTATITVILNAPDTIIAASSTFYHISQVDPFGSVLLRTGQGLMPSMTIPSAANQLIFSFLTAAGTGAQVTTPQTLLWQEAGDILGAGAYSVGEVVGDLSWKKLLKTTHWAYLGLVLEPSDLVASPFYISWQKDAVLAQAEVTSNDLLFVDSKSNKKLASEIDAYHATTGALHAWVVIPKVSVENDSEIFLYYGKNSSIEK